MQEVETEVHVSQIVSFIDRGQHVLVRCLNPSVAFTI